MKDASSTGEELLALRRAAERGDGNRCWEAARNVLRQMPAQWAMQLVRDFVARRLPAFERHQPGVQWPREFIESVTQDGMVDEGRSWPEADSEFPGPGANSFTSAVEALWRAGRHLEDSERRSELLADAMERAVSAERLEYWGSRHPDAWARWYQLAASGSDDVSRFEVLRAIRKEPDAARVEREAWQEAAQRLEEALSASTHEPS